jgi:alkylation response protein AidB-like acyl-CoA dehydrogenase
VVGGVNNQQGGKRTRPGRRARHTSDRAASSTQPVIRRNDYTLGPAELDLQEHFRRFFREEVPIERVRAAGDLGFDVRLWGQLAGLGALAMGVPADMGGIETGLVGLLTVAEEFGAVAAPTPLIETFVATRLLARCGGLESAAVMASAAAGEQVVTIAPASAATPRSLVPAGAVATRVVGLDGSDLVLVSAAVPPALVRNQASAPLAWWDLAQPGGGRLVLASGAEAERLFSQSVDEWKVLTAGALVGLAGTALGRGLEYAKVRHAFDAPIGTFQAVANSLVDASIAVEGGRNLNLKTAWFIDHEPAEAGALPAMAYHHAGAAAYQALTAAIHVHGAAGLLMEGVLPEYFLRVKAWSVLAGDPRQDLDRIAKARFGPLSG